MADPAAYTRLNYLDPQGLLARHPQGGVTVLLRHAERYPFEKPADVLEAGLTPVGIEQARQFGARLGAAYGHVRIHSSPIDRCLDTSRHILAGAGRESAVAAHWWLFSPFLREDVDRSNSGVYFSSTVADEEPPFPDSIYLPQRLEILARRIHTPARKDQVFLYIAHDTTVLPMLAYLLGLERVNIRQMPAYLEGIALVRREGRLALDDPDYYMP
jgi:hypothetical protein